MLSLHVTLQECQMEYICHSTAASKICCFVLHQSDMPLIKNIKPLNFHMLSTVSSILYIVFTEIDCLKGISIVHLSVQPLYQLSYHCSHIETAVHSCNQRLLLKHLCKSSCIRKSVFRNFINHCSSLNWISYESLVTENFLHIINFQVSKSGYFEINSVNLQKYSYKCR